jgi:hypothetical protein
MTAYLSFKDGLFGEEAFTLPPTIDALSVLPDVADGIVADNDDDPAIPIANTLLLLFSIPRVVLFDAALVCWVKKEERPPLLSLPVPVPFPLAIPGLGELVPEDFLALPTEPRKNRGDAVVVAVSE